MSRWVLGSVPSVKNEHGSVPSVKNDQGSVPSVEK
jgi:hypothetical protein